jgi:hypothetical protein
MDICFTKYNTRRGNSKDSFVSGRSRSVPTRNPKRRLLPSQQSSPTCDSKKIKLTLTEGLNILRYHRQAAAKLTVQKSKEDLVAFQEKSVKIIGNGMQLYSL